MALRTLDPPVLRAKAAAAQADTDARSARRFLYLVVLLQETGVDPKKVPQEEIVFRLMTPLEKLGYTTADIESWIQECDPEIKPSWDPVECFRAKVKAALRPRMSLLAPVSIAAGVAFAAAFALTRRRA